MKNKTITPLVVSIFVGLLLVVLYIQRSLANRVTPTSESLETQEESQTITKPAFDYTVTAISEEEIILEGDKGSMSLPKESVEVREGDPSSATSSSIQMLKVGDRVKLEFVPSQKAWIYIL